MYLLPGFSELGQKLTPIDAPHQGESTGVRILKTDEYTFHLFINSAVLSSGAASKIDTNGPRSAMGAEKMGVPSVFMTNCCTGALCDEDTTVRR